MSASFKLIRSGEKNGWIEVILKEGRNRQIRKMFMGEAIEVIRLIRVQIGTILLGDLAKGEWRVLNEKEIKVSLLEGSVKVSNLKDALIIKPGQQVVAINNLSLALRYKSKIVSWLEFTANLSCKSLLSNS